ncbi:MAG TPA: cytochrome c [Verrucomicrobiae bacterium]|nr:cytochrome c [Methylomirabilota bacterium]HWN92829.1 cytochrome c [Verrucomicrobiae bacterium]
MTRRANLRRSLVLIPLVAATLAACTTAAPQRMVGTDDVVFDRQRIMKVQGAMWTDIQNKFKAGNVEAIAPNAEVIAITALQIPTLFPEGSLTEKSKAKPELWQRRDEFDKAAKNLAVWSERLRDASKAKDEKAVADIMKDYGRVGCGSCHTPFRQPPPRS